MMQRTLIAISVSIVVALASSCSPEGGASGGTDNGPTAASGVDREVLVNALVHCSDPEPGYAWSFDDKTFLLESLEAAQLPAEVVQKAVGVQHATPWVRGEWHLADGGKELVLSNCQCFSQEGTRGSGVLEIEKLDDGGMEIDGIAYKVEAGAAHASSLKGKARLVAFKDRAENKWGYRDSLSGEVELPAIYKMVWEFSSEGLACVWDEEPFIINAEGEQIVQPLWIDNAPDPFKEGLARYVDGQGKIGYYDPKGNIRVPAEWSYAESYEGAYALVNAGGRVMSITDSNNIFTDHKLVPGGKWGMIDRRGELVLKPEYPNLERGEGGMVRIAAGEPWFQVGGAYALERE